MRELHNSDYFLFLFPEAIFFLLIIYKMYIINNKILFCTTHINSEKRQYALFLFYDLISIFGRKIPPKN
jgi:hypothetical protein